MGQAYSLTTLSAASANIEGAELSDLQVEKSLGAARFMKTMQARHKDGLVIVRVVNKPYANLDFGPYRKRLIDDRRLLADIPNALGYQRIVETATAGYLVRQCINSSLYDRLNTRPFLEEIEKKWLSFQLLNAVRDCHAQGLYHGDIKTENVLVTSWNWLYLTDFSSAYKPTYLPEDNPADFSFYFDMSGRRTCYLAPERFFAPGMQPEGEQGITWAMDSFSVGCVIAELFLEAPVFTLSQLFKYRQNEYDPVHSHLSKIHDPHIRDIITQLIQLDPNSRLSADDCLNDQKGKAFPIYFYGFLQQYMHSITDPTSGRKAVTTPSEHLGEPDDRIDQIYNDFDKITSLLAGNGGIEHASPEHVSPKPNARLFPLTVDIPNYQHQVASARSLSVDDGNLIFLTLIVSSIRGTARASSRLRAFELLLAFSERLTDEAKLDRVVPYVAGLLLDKSDQVKIGALRTLTQILAMVQVVSPVNAYVFPDYVLQRLEPYLPDSSSEQLSPLVRMHYAWCIGTLATTAARYLDMIQALRAEGTLPSRDPTGEDALTYSINRNQFDLDRQNLLTAFEKHTTALLTDSEASVRRAMLKSVSDLCVFFGSPKANDVVLSHLNTYLNDQDWILRCAFFDAIVGVAVFVGGTSLEGYILPLMVQALTDSEEFVVEKVIRAFSSIAELGLLQRSKTWELVDIVARLTMHPNLWIREAAAQFISAASKYLSVADTHSILVNLIRPYLKIVPSGFSELRLLDALKRPLPRLVLDMASTWALTAQKGQFWVPARQLQTFTFGSGEDTLSTISGRQLDLKVLQRHPKTVEDEQWLKKLHNAGMTTEDEFKLVALREFIWRVSHRRRSDSANAPAAQFNSIVALKDLEIIPETVLFEPHAREVVDQVASADPAEERYSQPRTIADALRDASMTEADGTGTSNSPTTGTSPLPSGVNAHRNSLQITAKLSPSPSEIHSGPDSASDVDSRRNSLQIPRSSPDDRSPVGSLGAAERRSLRHRPSALSLLSKRENKAHAEIGTTSANAFGKVDGPSGRESSRTRKPGLSVEPAQSASRVRFKEAHNYRKNNPTVLKLLDSMLLENLPPDDMEFGPRIQIPSRRQPIKYKDTGQTDSGVPWRPEGVLVATFGEHTDAVSRILVSPDHTFFITGSDDGTVKVWDASRLERNVSRRSRQTFRLGEGVKVTSLVFLEQSYCFAATGSDGSVHVVRVNHQPSQDGGSKFSRLSVLREYQLPEGSHVVWSEHYKDETKSILVLATTSSQIVGLDLRTMTEVYTLKNPLDHGTPTCFCVDRSRHWLILGTTHGVLDIWDLRFHLLVKSSAFHGSSPIHRLVLRKPRKGSPKLYIAGGTGQGEFSVWDIEKFACREVYRTGHAKDLGTKSTTLLDLDDEKPAGMLGRFATSLEPTANSSPDHGIRALTVNMQAVDDKGEPRHLFLLTAGPDWKVRYWDTVFPTSSMVVSGLETAEGKPTYSLSQPGPETVVISERFPNPQGGIQASPANLRNGGSKRTVSEASTSTTTNAGTPKKGAKSGLLSLAQQNLLKGHLDVVMDVALIERPYGMVVSADRRGVVYLWM